MATGAEHYRQAERLLARAAMDDDGTIYEADAAYMLAAAQVHATLALAAAIGVGMPVVMGGEECMPQQDSSAWIKAASNAYNRGDA